MTKEEIALQHGLCTCDKIYTSRGMKAPDCPWHARAVEEAMDAYARQEAIEFGNFLKQYNPIERTRGNVVWWDKNTGGDYYTTSVLYDLYTHKNKSDVNK